MSLLRLHNVSKGYDGQVILREAYFRLSNGEKIGLIGKNGSGKTTLLRLILGCELPDSGTVSVDDGLNVGYFSQFSELSEDDSIDLILEEIFQHIHRTESELAEIGEQLSQNEYEDGRLKDLLARQARLLDVMDREGGWTYRNQIDSVLSQLGFSALHRSRPVRELSGGWRNRAALAQILLQRPDILLLDEPTNFLDLQGLTWLENWLKNFSGGVILVSHDRHFLEQSATSILEIENYHLQAYGGGYDFYIREKCRKIRAKEKQFLHEEALLVFESEAINDRREAMKNPSEHLKRKLANIKKQIAPRPVDKIVTRIYDGLYVSNNICRIDQVKKRYDDQLLFDSLSFEIHRGDRLAIVGANGIGKSTLIRIITRTEAPDSGRVVWEGGMKPAYFNEALDRLDPDATITRYMNVRGLAETAPRKHVNLFLSLLRFSEFDLQRRIRELSGGEKARVALAQCLLSGAAVVVLDEPTNHLDITATQAMERALVHFPGAVVVASHDRFFIDTIANRLLVFEAPGQLRTVDGNWTTWYAQQGMDGDSAG
ncbi:MAG: ABC-F family ATP-binding cassette domain-containing protein [Candidatus Latescibacteria bacterium]|jgi:ATPase subunit of ABC transporter with duplicated ATPase domains|nr:ABC-F family ATP-binding cassette domain-containing protein [Candidatus Latescibacterota bacterium]